jgi:two-component system phosphate regulon sensor histidine kinase PhoR
VKGEDIFKSAKSIVKQTETMTALVEDMLMLSRLENLKEKQFVESNLASLLAGVIDQLSPYATQRHMTLIKNDQKIIMSCDPIDMQKLFKNLIENAIKYSEENKMIKITLKLENHQVIFIVKDQGFGISKENQQRVFERFYRVDKGRLDGGTGLGLAIVKHIVMKYNGEIDLESTLSKGTTITVTLPLES